MRYHPYPRVKAFSCVRPSGKKLMCHFFAERSHEMFSVDHCVRKKYSNSPHPRKYSILMRAAASREVADGEAEEG
jgi:hypothetical protein